MNASEYNELNCPKEKGVYLGKWKLHEDWGVVAVITGNDSFLKVTIIRLSDGEVIDTDLEAFYFSDTLTNSN